MERLNELLNRVLISYSDGVWELTVLNVVLIVATLLAVFVLRWAVGQAMLGIYENFNLSKENKTRIRRFLNTVIVVFAVFMILKSLKIDPYNDILETQLFPTPWGGDNSHFTIGSIFVIAAIYIFVRTLMWIIEEVMSRYSERENIDVGTRYAITQVIKYVIYTIAILSILGQFGVKLTLIWGGAAALLVGFGLGLQQTFNDLVSGLLLLIERTVEVGDTLEVDGTVGIVERIGIRVSHVRTRDDIMVLVPNSMLVTSKVINWTHDNDNTRFNVAVGVAYGSDTSLVKKLLLEVVNKHEKVETYPTPFVQFVDFGASSLDFKVFFWSKEAMRIEVIKSDLRFEIDQAFRENKVEIPFPQRDVWMRSK